MSVSQGVSATYGGSVSVSAKIVSAAVNFSVTSTYTVSDSQTVTIPSGKTRAEVIAHPIYDIYQYDIWEKDLFFDDSVGYGHADKPVGVCFDVIYS
ncbi:hypothetical protein [Paenibacillus sp. FSL W8-0194]|uniref:DUF6426 family protein n=1 Tax=Paenibacillus sp. FSL W8-0194 TaxID=2921711 RepID=UPI0030D8D735